MCKPKAIEFPYMIPKNGRLMKFKGSFTIEKKQELVSFGKNRMFCEFGNLVLVHYGQGPVRLVHLDSKLAVQ
jgi:transposase-like protein